MRSRASRPGILLSVVLLLVLGVAAAGHAAVVGLGQVNDDPGAGIDPDRRGRLRRGGRRAAAGGDRVPWVAFEQQTAGEQQIFVRSFKTAPVKTQGRVAEHRPGQEAEAPSIDFAGAGRTVPWVSWYEPTCTSGRRDEHLRQPLRRRRGRPGARGPGPRPGQQGPLAEHPHRPRRREPGVVGGAAVAGANPVPWVAWQERTVARQRHVATTRSSCRAASSRPDCSGQRAGRRHEREPVLLAAGRHSSASRPPAPPVATGDPTLNIDPTRDGVEPDDAFTGASDTVAVGGLVREGPTRASACAPTSRSSPPRASPTPRRTAASAGWRSATAPRGRPTCWTPPGPTASALRGEHRAEDACSLNLAPTRDAEDRASRPGR